MAFCGTRISPRMSRDNAGNLVCHGAVIARTGKQTYRGRELGLGTDDLIEVYRGASEVLSPAAIASAEGKILTENHPPAFLSPDNAGYYAKGHVQNVREGPRLADGNRCLVADIVVHDANLISKIRTGGLREISAGYDCTYVPLDDGSYEQRRIRINHVAVVPSGRCGAACRVHDHKEQPMTKEERKQLDEAMKLVRELNETFRDRYHAQDCEVPQADDRDYGENMKKLHRVGNKPQADREAAKRVTTDSIENWAEAMNAFGRKLREGRK